MAGDEVTLGGIKIELGADEEEFSAAGKQMGKEISDALTGASKKVSDDIKKTVGGATGAARGGGKDGGGAGLGGVGAGVGAGAGLAGLGRRLGGSAISRVAGGGGAGILAAAGTAAGVATGAVALPVIIALAAAGIAAFAFVATMKKINRLLTSEAARLSGLSASLAIAAVEKTIRKLNRDLDRARAIGPVMLDVTRMIEKIKDRIAPLANVLLVTLAGQLNILVTILDFVFVGILKSVDLILAVAASFARLHGVVLRFIGGLMPFGTGELLKLLGNGFDLVGDDLDRIRKMIQEGIEGNERNSDLNKIFAEQLATLAGRSLPSLFPNAFPPGSSIPGTPSTIPSP